MTWTWRKTSLALVGVGVAAALYIFVIRTPGDDQPPIIVSDGSIHLKGDFDKHGNGRGEWELVDNANPLVWAYRQSGGKATGRIDVNVFDGTNDACDNANEVFPAVRVVARYTGGVTVTFVFDEKLQKFRRLQATFAGLPVDNLPKKRGGYDYWLEAGLAGTKLESAEIWRSASDTTPVQCTLGEYGEIRIVQRKE